MRMDERTMEEESMIAVEGCTEKRAGERYGGSEEGRDGALGTEMDSLVFRNGRRW
jgi:hypothetical protein